MEGVDIAVAYWLILLAVVAGPAAARFVVETNSLSVATPESLKGNYDSAIGNFGVPQYGGTMSGRVIYPTENTLACQEFTSSSSFRSHAGERPNMVLVDRGDCYFALKVWNAQKAGAAAVLVADDRDEPLLTMDTPAEDDAATQYLDNITVPSALLSKAFGDRLRASLQKQEMVTVTLDWRESLPHPDDRVEYEFWTNSNDECGQKCDDQVDFVRDFRGAAQILERGGYTLFTPHYITWYCPESFVQTQQCKSQCINNGRYCTPDPEQDFSIGYEGKDVLMENLRQLCVYQIANQTKTPWVWWDYVTDFHLRCPMKEQKFNQNCAEEVLKSLGLDAGLVRNCMGNPDADAENPILKAEQDAQIGQGTRGDVTMLPTLLVNNRQYRGKLERGAVLKAICSGFEESTEPSVCLTSDMETNECMENNGGCWKDANSNITACKDTFRGRVCVCPLVNGVQFHGDGYTKCDPSGVGRCQIKNGGCWQGTKNDKSFSACQDSMQDGCKCPDGFKGDGVSICDDIDECKEKTACQCPECNCKNTWGSFECTCSGDLLYMKEQDICISKGPRSSSKAAWVITTIVILALAAVGVGAYVIYKYRLRSYMDSEIRAIMAQYMPLDNQGGVQHLDNDP